ncbi:hypothetical protein OG884_15525 [Streptosporangium sp. NBC_01755]|uniref:hypothetical protein n=1 Tax=Streptosporangium sp. NBC_01755 TaxID=2975949 RepID=UPI002DD7A689|nr:hypothetical protein [Streptosporangium sp. NBC_01755]WSD03244.1 hypothetical protein OG884_15525 [Streptosporangium sp. NBC_01755]
MADRHNLCVNPALVNDGTGWAGEAAPTRTAVSGFDRPFAARYTSGTFIRTPAAPATAGLEYTVSVYLRPANFSGGGTIYFEWLNAGGGPIGYPSASYTVTLNVVSRASITGVAPEGAASVRLILDGINYSLNTVDATMLLIEQAAGVEDYFDGDSPGAAWDGVAGSSASTLPGGAQVEGEVTQTHAVALSAAGVNTAVGAAAVTASAALTAEAVAGRSASLMAAVEVFAEATVTRTPIVSTPGGWWTLLDIAREAAADRQEERDRVPTACPNDGEPLAAGPRGELHCRFDGWTYPRDWVRA